MRAARPLRLVGALSGLLIAGTLVATPAGAAEPVFLPDCVTVDGETGSMEVPAGPTQLFVDGWGTGPRGALVHWLKSQTGSLTVEIDGVTTTWDAADLWAAPTRFSEGGKGWFSVLLADVVLPPDEVVTVTYQASWSKPTIDFFFGERPRLLRGNSYTITCELITT